MKEILELVALAAGTATVAAIVGALVLRGAQTRSIGVQAAAVALVSVVAVGVGAWAGARVMFISSHDLGALGVMLLAAGVVAVVTSLVLGRRVQRASDALAQVTRRLGDGESVAAVTAAAVPPELARLRRELEETSRRLDDARARETALETSRRELVAWVSHDLRTPLAGIRAVIEALEDGVADDPETVTRYHTTVREEADRLAALVDDLFELSRTQAGVLRLEFERVSLGDLVSAAIATAAPVATAKGVQLEGHLDARPTELEVSAPEVLRALRNILENAIRHTPSDGAVVVEAGRDAERAYVSVTDTGGGIPEADLPRVFEVAFRGDTARTPGNGAGLGLAIARGLVEAHHGEVSVRNENGGACFTVRLPLSKPA